MYEEFDSKRTPISAYQVGEEVAAITKKAKDVFYRGYEILHQGWPELNSYSVIERDNRDQRVFNAFVDEGIEDPAEAWRWRGTRSMARNKGIATHANLTSAYYIPVFDAQNDNDEIDKDFSEIMRDIVEWMTLPTVSDYRSSFLSVTQGMLTNTVTYMGAEFHEVYQTVREKTEKGYSKKEILDDVFSGFKAPIYSASQILITNAYERNIQRQYGLIKSRYIDYSEAEAKYGEHENWDFVQPGVKSIFNQDDGLFYDIKDDNNPTLIEENTFLCRTEDVEIVFLNGIYFGESDVENNPIKHRDNRGAPKYNIIPFGYHRIGEHFFFYKSLMNSLGWDNALYDAMSEVVMNRAMLELEMPIAVSGTDKIDSDIIFPSSVTTFEDKDTKVFPLLPQANFVAGFNSLRETENSISDGSVSDVTQGQLPQASQKAYSVAQAASNAKKILMGVGRTLAESIAQYGLLMADIALQHLTVAQVGDIAGNKLKYRSFLLENKDYSGRKLNKRIRFDEMLMGREMTAEEERAENLKLLEASGYPGNKDFLYLVNPDLFAKFKYLSRVEASEMFPKNDEFWQAIMQSLYGILRDDPYINQEDLRRKLLYPIFHSGTESLMNKQMPSAQQLLPGVGSPIGQQAQNIAAGNVLGPQRSNI